MAVVVALPANACQQHPALQGLMPCPCPEAEQGRRRHCRDAVHSCSAGHRSGDAGSTLAQ